ncbi:MAG: hypothetical protein IKJ59_12835 [Clostridia bacterium]|nr:hypothetical protein [Clostridia bacterium]
MIIGDPYVFSVIFDRVKQWNSTQSDNNGFFALSVYGELFPKCIINAVVDTSLLEVWKSLNNIPVDDELFSMCKEKALNRLCDLVYPSDWGIDNDYRYELAPTALTDKNCYVFVVSNNDKIRIIAAELDYDIEESTLITEGADIQEVFIDKNELNQISDEIKSAIDGFKKEY